MGVDIPTSAKFAIMHPDNLSLLACRFKTGHVTFVCSNGVVISAMTQGHRKILALMLQGTDVRKEYRHISLHHSLERIDNDYIDHNGERIVYADQITKQHHVMIVWAFRGGPPKPTEQSISFTVDHKNGVKGYNDIENLCWADYNLQRQNQGMNQNDDDNHEICRNSKCTRKCLPGLTTCSRHTSAKCQFPCCETEVYRRGLCRKHTVCDSDGCSEKPYSGTYYC